jgi:integrase
LQYNITYREKDNSWQYIISYKDSSGKWKQKSKQGFEKSRIGKQKAKDSAEEALKQLKEEVEFSDLEYVECKDITFGEFVDMHLKHLQLHRENNTVINYRNALNQFSDLKDIKFKKIRNIDIQNCVDNLVKRGLKPSTLEFYVKRLSSTLNTAVDQYKIISKTPLNKIKIPEVKEQSTRKALTVSEYKKLLDVFRNSPYYIILVLAGSCGMRVSEILGLTWDCIDFDYAILTINKQWKIVKDKKYEFGSLKGTNSYRRVPLSPTTIRELQIYKSTHCTDIYNRVVINKSTGTIITNLNKVLKKNGFKLTIHELRHTYATRLIANGIDFKTAAAILGHDVKQTMHTYSHVTEDMFNNAAKKINDIFI